MATGPGRWGIHRPVRTGDSRTAWEEAPHPRAMVLVPTTWPTAFMALALRELAHMLPASRMIQPAGSTAAGSGTPSCAEYRGPARHAAPP